MRPALSEEEYRLFSEWLTEELGLHYGPEKRDMLRARLEPRRAELGHPTFEELFFHLKFHPQRERELERLIPRLTNNESYFLRERRQLELLAEEVLPVIRARLRREERREVRLLSAGCGRGEEAYTLALVARETGLFSPPWSVRVTGVDLDPAALETARLGLFTAHSFRGVEEEMRARYFRAADGRWEVRAPLRRMVAFRRGNLVQPGWSRGLPPQDAIFCRNVLIYFDQEAVSRAVKGLQEALAPGGFLFLGHSESLSRTPHSLETERRPGAVFYHKPEA